MPLIGANIGHLGAQGGTPSHCIALIARMAVINRPGHRWHVLLDEICIATKPTASQHQGLAANLLNTPIGSFDFNTANTLVTRHHQGCDRGLANDVNADPFSRIG